MFSWNPLQENGIWWSRSCPVSPLYSYFWKKSLVTNKQPVGRNFETMQISCQSSPFPPWFGIHWFLPDPTFTGMVVKWWFSNSSISFTFNSRPSVIYNTQVSSVSPLLFLYYWCGLVNSCNQFATIFGGFLTCMSIQGYWSVVFS